jgi:hypothetical protein
MIVKSPKIINGHTNLGRLPPLNKKGASSRIATGISGKSASGLTGVSPPENLATSGELVTGRQINVTSQSHQPTR